MHDISWPRRAGNKGCDCWMMSPRVVTYCRNSGKPTMSLLISKPLREDQLWNLQSLFHSSLRCTLKSSSVQVQVRIIYWVSECDFYSKCAFKLKLISTSTPVTCTLTDFRPTLVSLSKYDEWFPLHHCTINDK